MSNDTKEASEVTKEGTKTPVVKTTSIVPSVTPKKTSSVAVTKTLTKAELETLDYVDYSTPARMMELSKVLVSSQLVPMKKPEDVVVCLMAGRDLGLPFMTSVSQIYAINGRATLGVHIQRSLCLKNGVTYEKIEDAVQIYNFVRKEEGGGTTQMGEGTIEELPKGCLKKAIDRRTTYLFTREIRMPSGRYKEITAKGSFGLREATEADLITKDVWVKFWRRMLDARAFTNGVKEIAADITGGLYAPNELSNDFYINDQGDEVHKAEII